MIYFVCLGFRLVDHLFEGQMLGKRQFVMTTLMNHRHQYGFFSSGCALPQCEDKYTGKNHFASTIKTCKLNEKRHYSPTITKSTLLNRVKMLKTICVIASRQTKYVLHRFANAFTQTLQMFQTLRTTVNNPSRPNSLAAHASYN